MHLNNAIVYFELINKCLIINLINYRKFKEQKYLTNKRIKYKYN